METLAALLILTPVFMPVIKAVGIDPVHFGLVMVLNLMIGTLTPPVGIVLFVVARVAKLPFEDGDAGDGAVLDSPGRGAALDHGVSGAGAVAAKGGLRVIAGRTDGG